MLPVRLFLFASSLLCGTAWAAEHSPYLPQATYMAVSDELPKSRRVLIDVRSNHSDGMHDFETLVELAKERAINTMVFTEHDRYTIRLGLEPVGNLIGYSMEHPSLYQTGVDQFFADLQQTKSSHPDMNLFAGTESTPGYQWSGLPYFDLSLHGAERHLITLGLNSQAQLEMLPSFTLEHVQGPPLLSMLCWGLLAALFYIWLLRRRSTAAGVLCLLSIIPIAVIWLQPKPIDADAEFIAKAKEQGLFTIWTHPGTKSGVREGPMGVQLDTPPYSERVFRLPTTEAFAGVYGDTDANCEPGGLWDRYMLGYLHGSQPYPIWSVAAGDYHGEGEAGEYLGNFPMDVWMEGDSEGALLKALRSGRNTGWQQHKNRNAGIEVLMLEEMSGQRHLPGSTVTTGSTVRLLAAAREYVPQAGRSYPPLQGEWIVDGDVAAKVALPLAGDRLAVTELLLPPGSHLIRLRIPAGKGVRMVANPFLVRVQI